VECDYGYVRSAGKALAISVVCILLLAQPDIAELWRKASSVQI
jgi:hypothetical protein